MVSSLNNVDANKAASNSSWLHELDIFLRSQGAFPVVKLHGLLTAISSSPNMIMPSRWLSIAKIQEIIFDTSKQANEIVEDIMCLYNNVNSSLRAGTYKPVLYIPSAKTSKDSGSVDQIWQDMMVNARTWVEGYIVGMEATWPINSNSKFDSDMVNYTLEMLYYLNLPPQEMLKECQELNVSVENFYKLMIDFLPTAAITMYDFWVKPGQSNPIATEEFLARDGKIGRNDDCPCGSGRKYKKCCLH